MDWSSLLKPYRLGCPKDSFDGEMGRTEFHRDFDRIIFSSNFRRLFGKTQVVPFPDSDLTHNRLTHSLETASVGRSLGNYLKEQTSSSLKKCDYDIGSILAASCLAHDIGNPPLGHSGEHAIQEFFIENEQKYLSLLSEKEKCDFLKFNGNAMGFRMLTRSNPAKTSNYGGLGITYPVLASFTKYPCASYEIDSQGGKISGYTKSGLFSDDVDIYSEIAHELEIPKINEYSCWERYPLVFLAEAADDICNYIIDYEDGYKNGLISYDSLYSYFNTIAETSYGSLATSLNKIHSQREIAGYLRAKAIGSLVIQVSEVFIKHERDFLQSKIKEPLITLINSFDILKEIQQKSIKKLYNHRDVLLKEIAGFKVLSGLLEIYLDSAMKPLDSKSKKILQILPSDIEKNFAENQYNTLMDITTYVCGMTDKFAVDQFRKLTGIEVPDF